MALRCGCEFTLIVLPMCSFDECFILCARSLLNEIECPTQVQTPQKTPSFPKAYLGKICFVKSSIKSVTM